MLHVVRPSALVLFGCSSLLTVCTTPSVSSYPGRDVVVVVAVVALVVVVAAIATAAVMAVVVVTAIKLLLSSICSITQVQYAVICMHLGVQL